MAVRCTVTPPSKIIGPIRQAVAVQLLAGGHKIRADWAENIPHDWPGQSGAVTGNTARDIRVTQPSQTSVVISTGTISGKSLERGARAHEIRPRGRYPLKWPASRGGYGPAGAVRVRKVARHPGVRARYIGQCAVTFNRAAIFNRIVLAIRAVSR